MQTLLQDICYAARNLRRSPTFTSVVVLSLALGIGANTAIYSFMESILLRPLPVPDPESLVILKWQGSGFPGSVGFSFSTGGTYRDPDGRTVGSIFPYSALELFGAHEPVLSTAFGYFRTDQLNVTIGEETTAVNAQYVTGDYFPGMGIGPAAGRLIGPSDDVSAEAVTVLGQAFSRKRFGDPARAVGQSIRINDRLFTVVGVVTPEFFGAEPGSVPDLYVPVETIRLLEPQIAGAFLGEDFYWIEIMGRLSPGVTAGQAETALQPEFQRLVRESQPEGQPDNDLPILNVMAGGSGLDSLRREYSRSVYVLLAMVGVILLIACANIANLLLARSTARRREIAVRLSIGAGRSRIIRQLLTESVLLSIMGGILGLFVAGWGMRVLTLLMANGRENFTLHAELNGNVLGVTLLLSIFTGLLFGLAPAMQSLRVDVTPALKATSSASVGETHLGGRRFAVGSLLVTAQIAMALVLLIGASLFDRTLRNLYAIDVGIDPDNVLLFRLNTRAADYEGPALHRVFEDLRRRLSEIPGVETASLSARALPSGGTMAPVAISGAAMPQPADGQRPNMAGILNVGPAFFTTMRVTLVAGREFEERDRSGAPPVAIVNRRLTRIFGLENPVGRNLDLGFGGNTTTYEIVGLVEDALWVGLKQSLTPVVYFPYSQRRPPLQMTYEVRTSSDPLAYAGTIREVVQQFDSRLAVSDVTTQGAHLDRAISQEITLARLATAFAILALATACIGLYGTMSFQVAHRTPEIGLRMALGATSGSVVRLVLGRIFTAALAGLAISLPVALFGARYLEPFLYGIQPNDPEAVALAMAILLAAGLVAAFLPARRAAGIDPMVALRHE